MGLEGFLVGEKRIVRFDAHAAGCNSGSPVYKHDTFEVYAIVTQAYSNEGKGVLIKEEVVQGLRAAVRINLSSRVYLPLVRR